MLAGTLDWIPAPRTVTPPQPRHESPPPQEFTPAQHSHTYRKPPKPRAERRRVKLDSTEADSAHTGDARELIGTQVRRQPTTKSLHDPRVAFKVEDDLSADLPLVSSDRIAALDESGLIALYVAVAGRKFRTCWWRLPRAGHLCLYSQGK